MNNIETNSNKIVFIGGGGHCRSVLDTAIRLGSFSEIVITDSNIEKDTFICGCRVIGADDILPMLRNSGFLYAFISVGSIENVNVRKRIINKANDCGFIYPVIADPSAIISEFAEIGCGTFVGKNAVINADVKIGNHCIINTGAVIEHECVVGNMTHVSVGCVMCGGSKVGNESFIGAGSIVIQGVDIGNHSIVGAGSTVLSNVSDHIKTYGIVKKY